MATVNVKLDDSSKLKIKDVFEVGITRYGELHIRYEDGLDLEAHSIDDKLWDKVIITK